MSALRVPDALANCGYTDDFYERHHTHEQQNCMRGHSGSTRQQCVGDIVVLNEMRSLSGESLTTASGSGHCVQILLQWELAKGMVAKFI